MAMNAMHRDAERLLDLVRAADRPPFESLPPAEARIAYATSRDLLQPAPDEVAEVADLAIPGSGGPLPLRLHRGARTPDGPPPCLVYLHGGGWVLGGLDSHDGVCRHLANLGACRVVALGYRLTPEDPFPAAVEDSAALAWVAGQAAGLGIDPARIAVGGDSAGGTLAAACARFC